MEYYKLLQLDREPFSNSPDPDYFFQSQQHLDCLQKLELALRLKRGLNVVIGDVGTGKTTLCRQLIRKFSGDTGFESHLILDPSFSTPIEFLRVLFEMFYGHGPDASLSTGELKESIKQSLFAKGIDENKTVVLIIDEGQKASESCVEILRELLNYETNTFKLLQIVIFAQLEFDLILQAHANFADRINLLHHLAPMNFKDSRHMVLHRLKLSSTGPKPKKLFTLPAMWAIYRASRGYPRKIINLCHQSMLAMIIQNRSQAGWSIIQSCKKRLAPTARTGRGLAVSGIAVLAVALFLIIFAPQLLPRKNVNPPLHKFKIDSAGGTATSPESNALTVVNPTPPQQPLDSDADSGPVPQTTAFASPTPIEQPGDRTDTVEPVREPDKLGDTPSPPEPAFPEARPSHPPQFLGQVIVKPGDTLVNLVYTVYGTYRSRYLKAVIHANPHIHNPDNIEIGDVILFPSLSLDPGNKNFPCHWIVLNEFASLPSAMQQYVAISSSSPIPLQIVPHWHADSGLRFNLSIKGFFRSEQEALGYTMAFPDELMVKTRVLSVWPDHTMFYSDPYAGGILKSPIIP